MQSFDKEIIKQDKAFTVTYTCDAVSFNCANCATKLEIKRGSAKSTLSGIFCQGCDECYYVNWDEGILTKAYIRKGNINNEINTVSVIQQ